MKKIVSSAKNSGFGVDAVSNPFIGAIHLVGGVNGVVADVLTRNERFSLPTIFNLGMAALHLTVSYHRGTRDGNELRVIEQPTGIPEPPQDWSAFAPPSNAPETSQAPQQAQPSE